MTKISPLGRFARVTVLAAALVSAISCASELTRAGRSSAFLIIDSLTGASGAQPGEYGTGLRSDVVTLVDQSVNGATVKVATTFNDIGKAAIRMAMKDPTISEPSPINAITLTRYRVTFQRADGRNTPGVDVPYGFDGALTGTVPTSGTAAEFGFELVRHTMKLEPPLRNLRDGSAGIFINTIAEVTFYGRDQAGNEVSVAGSMSVNFGDFGDPK